MKCENHKQRQCRQWEGKNRVGDKERTSGGSERSFREWFYYKRNSMARAFFLFFFFLHSWFYAVISLFCNKCEVAHSSSGLSEGVVLSPGFFSVSWEYMRLCIPAMSKRHLTLTGEDTVFSLGLPEGTINCFITHVTVTKPSGRLLERRIPATPWLTTSRLLWSTTSHLLCCSFNRPWQI